MILCDAGPLLSLVDRTQPQHNAYVRVVSQVEEPLVTTWACMAEAMHFALKRGQWPMQKQLLNFLEDEELLVINEIRRADYARLIELLEKYQDRPMDLADATLVLTAERIGETRILTLDSDFSIYRINGRTSFDIIQVERLG